MKYCPNCGAEVKENSKFCPKCGSSITNVVNEVNRNAMNSQNSKGSSNNVIIIAVAAVIIVAIIAGTFVFLSGNDSGSDVIVVNNSDPLLGAACSSAGYCWGLLLLVSLTGSGAGSSK